MWFVEVISILIHQFCIIAAEMHSQRNACMVRGIIINQWNKQPDDIYDTQQKKEKNV